MSSSRASTPVPDLVSLSKLETKFHTDPEYTEHFTYVSENPKDRRRIRKEERWKRSKRLGRGGFGTVWLEVCVLGDKKNELRAVKEVPKCGSGDYNRELEAVALFSHPKYEQCFVKSFGWYENDQDILLTMEFLPHGDLHKYVGSPFPERECQTIVAQILEGLSFMHAHGYAHRDLKPDNILVAAKGPDWWIKLADFGISKRAAEGLTVLRTVTGTPAFVAPEVLPFLRSALSLEQSYTNTVDIWSLSVITFLLLTGETLFKEPERLLSYVKGHIKFPMDTLLAHAVSKKGCEFVRRSLQKRPEDRPTVGQCQRDPWLKMFEENNESESNFALSSRSSGSKGSRHSARWTAEDLDANIHYMEPESERVQVLEDQIGDSVITPRESIAVQRWRRHIDISGLHSGHISGIAYSPDSKMFVSGSYDGSRVYSTTRDPLPRLDGVEGTVYGVAISPHGALVALGMKEKNIRLHNLRKGKLVRTLSGHADEVYDVAFSPDGDQLASSSRNGTIKLWDPHTGNLFATLKGHGKAVQSVTYSPDGHQLASGSSDSTLKLWDPKARNCIRTFAGHSASVWAVAFSPDGECIASASQDKTVKIWESHTGSLLRTLSAGSEVNSIDYSPDGTQLAAALDDGTCLIWDPIAGDLHQVLDATEVLGSSQAASPESPLVACRLAFAPHGRELAVAYNSGKIFLWEDSSPIQEDDIDMDSERPQKLWHRSQMKEGIIKAFQKMFK